MLGKKEEWEEVSYDVEQKLWVESGQNRWNNGKEIRYGGGHNSASARRLGSMGTPSFRVLCLTSWAMPPRWLYVSK